MLEAIALGSRSRCNCRRPAKFSYLWMKYQWMLPSVKTTTSKLFTLLRVPGCCIRCKRMWQLLELHSRLCTSYDVCRVPFVQGHLNYILQLQQLKTLSLGAYSGLGELRKK
ncbi:hypothetical protein I3760_15G141600 [Carya illinoinensis]|nr:hypothetical protein I3760_15G141600 [Carya illinoinensis]